MEENKIFLAVNAMMRTHRMHKQLIESNVSKIGIHSTHHRILMHTPQNGQGFKFNSSLISHPPRSSASRPR